MAPKSRLKVLVVSNSLGEGGAQRVTSTLLGALSRERFEPHLCLIKNKVTFPLPADVPVEVFTDLSDQPIARAAMRRPWIVPAALSRLTRHIDELRPDVVLSMIDQINCATGTALRFCRHPARWIARIGANPDREHWAQRLWARWAYRRADAVVVNARALVDGFARVYPDTRDRLHHLANPIDFDRLERLSADPFELAPPPNVPVVAFVGRLTWRKRPDVLIHAFARAREQRPMALWICATGPLEQELRSEIEHHGLSDSVRLLGFCDNPFAVLERADLFVLTSDVEGLPNALIEAQGLGLPAVSTDCPYGPNEIIEHGVTGLLTPTGDSDALADAMLDILSDDSRRRAMGKAAAIRARKRYGIAAVVPAWERQLEAVCESRS